jgi:hypothetical protein
MMEETKKAREHVLVELGRCHDAKEALQWAEAYATMMGWRNTTPRPVVVLHDSNTTPPLTTEFLSALDDGLRSLAPKGRRG